MKNITKKLVSVIMIAMMFTLTACSLFTFDASGYMKSILDATTRADFTKYMEFTKSTEEDAQAEYDILINTFLQEMSAANLSDEMTEKYKQVFIDMLAKTKYSVSEATKVDGNYSVDVTVETLMFADEFYAEVETKTAEFTNEIMEEYASTGVEPNEEDIYERSFQLVYDILVDKLENATYAEPQTVTITVARNADNVYIVSDADIEAVMSMMYDF